MSGDRERKLVSVQAACYAAAILSLIPGGETVATRRPITRKKPARVSKPAPKRSQMSKIPLDMKAFKCFGCSSANPYGLQLNFTRRGRLVEAEMTPAAHLQGWFGMVHGGVLSAMLE